MRTLMGPIGLAMAVVGMTAFMLGQSGIARAVADVSDDVAEPIARRLRWAVLPIGLALAIYFGARTLHHGRHGLYACVAILLANALTVALMRLRWAETALSPDLRPRHRSQVLMQLAGAWIGFVGCAVYLLRP
jgi:hypothetical protein